MGKAKGKAGSPRANEKNETKGNGDRKADGKVSNAASQLNDVKRRRLVPAPAAAAARDDPPGDQRQPAAGVRRPDPAVLHQHRPRPARPAHRARRRGGR